MQHLISFTNSIQKRLTTAKTLFACMLALCVQSVFAASLYTYSADGSEVTDTATGLVWRRCSVGQTWGAGTCTGTATAMAHQAALEHATNQAGWRLPNVKELSSIVSIGLSNPSIDVAAFPNTVNQRYWTSSPVVNDASNAWFVFFFNSLYNVGYSLRSDSVFVRLVR